jgi:hypothetical protein
VEGDITAEIAETAEETRRKGRGKMEEHRPV